jgi:hypothetical protein
MESHLQVGSFSSFCPEKSVDNGVSMSRIVDVILKDPCARAHADLASNRASHTVSRTRKLSRMKRSEACANLQIFIKIDWRPHSPRVMHASKEYVSMLVKC